MLPFILYPSSFILSPAMYLILAYYHFTPLENPSLEVRRHKDFFKERDVAGRIYLSEEGINGQMSGSEKDAREYMEWLLSDSRFSSLPFKVQPHHENIFARMTVKVRRQLVALDETVGEEKG